MRRTGWVLALGLLGALRLGADPLHDGTLRGRIVGPEVGEVRLVSHEAPKGVFYEGWDWPVSPDNTFESDHLPPGIWTLHATASGSADGVYRNVIGVVEILPGETVDYDLDFEYGELTLTVRLPRPGRAAKARLYSADGAIEAGAPLVHGAARFEHLQTGEFQVQALDEDDKTLAEKTMLLQSNSEVTIDLENGS